MTIKCDNCQASIKQESQIRVHDDIEITYLLCEECYSEYVISVTDSKLRQMIRVENELQDEIKKLHKAAHETYKSCSKQKQKRRLLKHTQKTQNKLMKQYQELKQEAKAYHEHLKGLYDL